MELEVEHDDTYAISKKQCLAFEYPSSGRSIVRRDSKPPVEPVACPAIPESRQGARLSSGQEAAGPPFPRVIQGGMLGASGAGLDVLF